MVLSSSSFEACERWRAGGSDGRNGGAKKECVFLGWDPTLSNFPRILRKSRSYEITPEAADPGTPTHLPVSSPIFLSFLPGTSAPGRCEGAESCDRPPPTLAPLGEASVRQAVLASLLLGYAAFTGSGAGERVRPAAGLAGPRLPHSVLWVLAPRAFGGLLRGAGRDG